MNVENLPITPFIFTAFKKIEKEKQPYLKLGPYSEISLEIFKKLGQQDLCRAQLVCKEWKQLIEQTEEWKSFHAKKVRDNSPIEKQQANLAPSQWDKHRIAECLWQDSSAVISESMRAKVNTAAEYLSTEGFELKGVPSDGDCFFSAFLGSYEQLSRKVPLLDDQENKISYLRQVLAGIIKHTDSQRALEIIEKGTWVSGLDEGDLLASALSIPIRLVAVNEEHLICGIHDRLIFSQAGLSKEDRSQEWETIPQEERRQEYIFIVDLGGHFIYAQKPLRSNKSVFLNSKIPHSFFSHEDNSYSPHKKAKIIVKTRGTKRALTQAGSGYANDSGKKRKLDSSSLANLPIKIFEQIFLSFSSLQQDELRQILDVRSCARIFKQHMPNNVKFLELYRPQKLQPYLDKLSNYLDKNSFSIDVNSKLLSVDRLEEACTHALKLAIQKEDLIQTRFYIEKLGDIHLIKGKARTLLQATGLYNYALHNSSLENQERIKEKLLKIENLLSELCKGKPLGFSIMKKQFKGNRQALKKFRQKIEAKIQVIGSDPSSKEVRKLYREIAHQIKDFFGYIVNQALDILGPVPCEYAMIGFGSLAREEMTPYSDLEFGILMQTDNSENRDYFKRLTTLIHLKVINLGETILPALNIPCLKAIDFFDGITPRGFAFDGAGVEGKGCKTPFGNGKTFELIQTPGKMAQYIAKDEEGQWWHKKEPHLPMELLTFTHLVGNPELTRQYGEELQEKLDITYREGFNLRQYLAKKHLVKADMEAFDPRMDDLGRQGMLFKVKNDFYRFPHLALDRLALLKEVEASTTFIRIEQLNKLGIITAGATDKLNEWMSIALFMRLKTYSHYKAQKEMMNPLIKPFGFDEPEPIKKQFALDPEAMEKIKKIYRIFIPFYQVMQEFLAGHEDKLKSSHLDDNSLQIQGNIALRLFQYPEAENFFILARKLNPKDPYALVMLGTIYSAQGNLNKAANYNQKALLLSFDENNSNRAAIYNNLGKIYQDQGKLDAAIEYINKALAIEIKLLGKDHSRVAVSYNNLGMIYKEQGNLKKAAEFVNKALTIELGIPGENLHKVARCYNNLGLIYQAQGNLVIATDCANQAFATDRKLFSKQHSRVAIGYNNRSLIYQEQGNLKKAAKLVNKALAIDLKLFGENHPQVASCYNNLGTIYHMQGKLKKAIECINQALTINLELFGKNHPDVASGYNNLGIIYIEQGNLGKAAESVNQSLPILLALFGEIHSKVASCYNSRGMIYQHQGYLTKAAKYVNKALIIDLYLFGENHPQVASHYSNLGQINQDQGKLGKAAKYVNKALTINLKLFGENHPQVAIDYNNLGTIYQELGHLARATEYAEKALDINRKLFGENYSRVATNYINLGMIYKEQGNLEKAAGYTNKALIIDLNLFGENHPTVAIDYNNLGTIYKERGNLKNAAGYVNKALNINLKLFGENHPTIAIDYNNLGTIYKEQGNLGKALEHIKKALSIDLKLFGENSPTVAIDYNDLGKIYQDQGDLEQAAEYIEKALSIDLKLFGENSPTVAIYYSNLGMIYQNQGNLKQAAEYAKKALNIKLQLFGENHPSTAISYDSLGQIYQKQGKLEKAVEHSKKALSISLEILEKNHPNIAAIYNNLGAICQEQGNLAEAAEYSNKALAIDLKNLGEIHPNVAIDYHNLGKIYQDRGKLKLAAEYTKKAFSIAFKVFGGNHPTVITICNSLITIAQAQREREIKEAFNHVK
jgi:tetratricopeptide (TPR) repeat protein